MKKIITREQINKFNAMVEIEDKEIARAFFGV